MSKRGRYASHNGRREWTVDMDTTLRAQIARSIAFADVADEMTARYGRRISEEAVRYRAEDLGIIPVATGRGTEAVDCRVSGLDHLLIALRTSHRTPPADARPGVLDRIRFDWRRHMAGPSGAGSPAASCLEG
ncbi:hypothetical protein KHC28_00275 [Ancylobacter sonchi]|uniref:hypothetical protein n=1 Tax=Ancylobacter sonchi TaxID=1937790 RepID=UPI001BD4A874|nr:hypothetical protein [Ancylobacter sonchi]MBS7532100.1 hypothetical protein [Ancylobacter sonchi]